MFTEFALGSWVVPASYANVVHTRVMLQRACHHVGPISYHILVRSSGEPYHSLNAFQTLSARRISQQLQRYILGSLIYAGWSSIVAQAFTTLTRSAGGDCRVEGPFVVENALRGRWKLRCAQGDLAVRITLAPTEPAQVQFLSVTATSRESVLSGPVACRRQTQ